MVPVEGKALRSMQRKAKKLAKDTGKSEADALAELLAEAGLEEQAEDVKENGKEAEQANGAAKNGAAKSAAVDEEGEGRTVSAVLSSHALSRDVHIEQFTLLFHGHELLMDAAVELNHGRCALERTPRLPPPHAPAQRTQRAHRPHRAVSAPLAA